MLLSLLALGFLALGFAMIGNASLIRASQSAVVYENKALASAAATACMEQAIDRLALSSGYAGNETLTVGTQTCTVRPVIAGGTWTIETSAQVGNQRTRYRTILSSRAPVVITSWVEVASF